KIGLIMNHNKTDIMTLNIASSSPVQIEDHVISNTETFTYLGSTISKDGGTSQDIRNRINKARNTFRSLNTVWKSSKYNTKTKLKIYQSCILSTLFYGAECWRVTEYDVQTVFIPYNLTLLAQNNLKPDLLTQCSQEDMSTIITRRRWRWIGHVLRMETDSIIRIAVRWTPEGK
ncbi:hypothetical protein HHUSO_G3931, partial [Huso huso]